MPFKNFPRTFIYGRNFGSGLLRNRRVTVPDQRTELVFIVQFRSKERELVTSSFFRELGQFSEKELGK